MDAAQERHHRRNRIDDCNQSARAAQGYLDGQRQVAVGGAAAGANNTLGVMKLEMLNPHAIYLHDTPSKGAF